MDEHKIFSSTSDPFSFKLDNQNISSYSKRKYLKILSPITLSIEPISLANLSIFSKLEKSEVIVCINTFDSIIHVTEDCKYSFPHVNDVHYFLFRYKKEVLNILIELIEQSKNDSKLTAWIINCNRKLQSIGATDLSIYLSEQFLNVLSEGTESWLTVMDSYIDMIHINGNYHKAASMYHELANKVVSVYGFTKNSFPYIRFKLREAHHLKFVSPIHYSKKILVELLNLIDQSHELYYEVCFTLYGSIGCLENPNQQSLQKLMQISDKAAELKNTSLQVKCLRRIVDLYLILNRMDDAKDTVKKAIQLAEPLQSRQRVYLYSTEGEVLRANNKLDESLANHTFTLQYSEKLGLFGWAGHGALGIAETYRMMGHKQRAIEYLDIASLNYKKASNQPWGMMHRLITKYCIEHDENFIQQALDISTKFRYQFERKYLIDLINKNQFDSTKHNGHFFMFP